MYGALGRLALRRPFWVIGVWLAVLVAGVAVGGQLFDRLGTVASLNAESESARGEARIEQLTDAGPVVYAVVEGIEVYAPEFGASGQQVVAAIKKVPGVVDVVSVFSSPGGRVGADNHSILITAELAERLTEAEKEAAEDAIIAQLRLLQAPTVTVGGDHLAQRAFGEQAARDLAVGESISLAVLLVALVLIFGGLLAALLPLAVAIIGVSATLLVLYLVSTWTTVGEYSLNIVTLLGIGLAVDYAMLIVARFREQRAAGDDVAAAIETAMVRAGRAVALSGLAVAAALAGLMVFAEPLLASMALGGAVSVLLTTALALTAVPALLALLGDRVPPAGSRSPFLVRLGRSPLLVRLGRAPLLGSLVGSTGTPLMVRLAGHAQRRPVAVALATTGGLLLLALPLVGANFANSDARALPASVEERRAYEAYQRLFNNHEASPVTVVAEVDPASAELRDYLNQLDRLGARRMMLRPDVPGASVIIDLTPEGVTAGTESREIVRAVRATPPAFPVLVTGDAAEVIDYQDSVTARLPFVVAAVFLAMFVLLYALTRSVVVPLKALLLNLLTLLASLGVLVAIFQWGWGEPVLGFDSWGAVDLTTPLLLFVFIFGVTMDYEVFLLARIKEEVDSGRPNDAAVLRGIAASGPVVTAAAVCITIVFLGFAVGGLVPVKEIGIGMAVAVILDVTVVRGLLLPAVMTLLGDRNWYTPWGRQALAPLARQSD